MYRNNIIYNLINYNLILYFIIIYIMADNIGVTSRSKSNDPGEVVYLIWFQDLYKEIIQL